MRRRGSGVSPSTRSWMIPPSSTTNSVRSILPARGTASAKLKSTPTSTQNSIETNTAWNKAVMTSFFVVVLGAIATAVVLSLK